MNQTHNTNFYEMLAAACRKNGKGTAVFNDKEKTTYHALRQEVDAVAAYLQNMGVKFGDKVALAVSNSPEFISAYFERLQSAVYVCFGRFAERIEGAEKTDPRRENHLDRRGESGGRSRCSF